MPDGTFNGVEILWIAAVILSAALALYAARRHAEVTGQEPDAAIENEDTLIDATFRGALDWPRGATHEQET